jgi:hypothetical protein
MIQYVSDKQDTDITNSAVPNKHNMKDTKPTTINYLKAAQTDEMTKQR